MMIFLITFLLMLLSGSIFILGFFAITRGKKVQLPNGEYEIEKEIFGDWQLFWEDIIKYKKIFYEGQPLEDKLKILEQMKPAYMGVISFTEQKKSLVFNESPTDAEIRDIEWSLNTHAVQKGDVVFLYDEFPVYRFSEFIRKLTNCHICMSSWIGGFYYCIINLMYPSIFNFAVNPFLWKIVFLAIYCVSLAFINKVIKENLDKDKK